MPAHAPTLLALAILVAGPLARAEIAVSDAHITGRIIDDPKRLLGFVGLDKGARYADRAELEQRVDELLKSIKYVRISSRIEARAGEPGLVDVWLELAPAQVIRHVYVKGNWPILDDEIKRRLTLRPGSSLALEGPAREAQLAGEAQRVKDFLTPYGYFGSDVKITAGPAGRPEWMNLHVKVTKGERFRLEAVEGHGNTVFDNKRLLHYFGPRWWAVGWFARLRLDRVRDDARDVEKAYQELGYPAARVLPQPIDPARDLPPATPSVHLRVEVNEKDKVLIHFRGNRALTEKQLRSRVTIFNAGSYDEVELANSAREIFRAYQSSGYLEAEVFFSRRRSSAPLPPGGLPEGVPPPPVVDDITFDIHEGTQLKVRAIDFVPDLGAAPITADSKELGRVISTRVFPRIGELGLGEGGFVTTVQLQQDVEKLIAFERTRGYPDARVRGELARDPFAFGQLGVLGADVAADYSRPGGEHDIFVRYFIDEGRRQTIGKVTVQFKGEHVRGEDEIRAVLNLPTDSPFSADSFQAARKRVVDLYAARGHPYAELATPVIEFDEKNAARIVLVVEEGPEVRFGEILVRGNFKTSEWVIRRDLPFKTGDLFDANKIALAERNLQTHVIFNGARVIPLGLAGRKVTRVPILIEITQERYDDYGTPQVSIGYSTDVGLLGTLGYFWGNVLGGGGQAELRGEIALDVFQPASTNYHDAFYRRLAVTLRYAHPHLIWPSLRAETAVFYRKENTVRLGEVISGGAFVSLSYVASPSFRFFLRYDWTLSSLQSIDFQRLAGRGDLNAAVNDGTRTGKLSGGLVFDDRVSFDGVKNALMPVSGWLVAGSVAAASRFLAGSRDFIVLSGQVQRYQPLGRDVSLIFNLRGDWGFPLDGPSLPAVDRFFAGGDVATRGFQTDKLRTEIVRGDVSPAPGVNDNGLGYKVIPEGGNIRFLGTVELQFPITTIAGFRWAGAIFADAGSVFDSPRLFNAAQDIKVSVGVSLIRLLTPVGPISLEYAYPITQTLAEQDWKNAPWYRHWPGLIHFNWGIPILR